jgi:hypothetical protein
MPSDAVWTVSNEIDADELEDYVVGEILDRIESEPAFLARSIAVLDEAEVDQEIAELETDPAVLQDVLRISRITWNDPNPDTLRLLTFYTIDRMEVGPDLGEVSDRVEGFPGPLPSRRHGSRRGPDLRESPRSGNTERGSAHNRGELPWFREVLPPNSSGTAQGPSGAPESDAVGGSNAITEIDAAVRGEPPLGRSW